MESDEEPDVITFTCDACGATVMTVRDGTWATRDQLRAALAGHRLYGYERCEHATFTAHGF